MAKMKSEMMMCPTGTCGPRCIILGLISAAFASAGLWLIVGAILKQASAIMPWTNVFTWYFGGFILFGVAKCLKMKACGMCR